MSRLTKIEGYAQRKAIKKEKEEEIYERNKKELTTQIETLQPRINDLLEVANICVKNDIDISMLLNNSCIHVVHNPHITKPKSKFEQLKNTFECKNNRQIENEPYNSVSLPWKGIYHLIVGNDGEFYEYCPREYRNNDKYVDEKKKKFIDDCEYFLENFDQFEADFYAYVDKIIEEDTKDEEKEQ